MMFYVFAKEKVDVAIVEVGIGGQYDYTNIIRYLLEINAQLFKRINRILEPQ